MNKGAPAEDSQDTFKAQPTKELKPSSIKKKKINPANLKPDFMKGMKIKKKTKVAKEPVEEVEQKQPAAFQPPPKPESMVGKPKLRTKNAPSKPSFVKKQRDPINLDDRPKQNTSGANKLTNDAIKMQAKGPAQLKQIAKHDVSNFKDSKPGSDDDSYGSDDAFDSDTEVKPKPFMKPNPKIQSNPFKSKQGYQQNQALEQVAYSNQPKKQLVVTHVEVPVDSEAVNEQYLRLQGLSDILNLDN